MRAVVTHRAKLGGMVFGFVVCGLLCAPAVAQEDCKKNPNVWCNQNTGTPPAPNNGPRNPRGGGRPRPPRAVSLALQWRLLKLDDKGWRKVVKLRLDDTGKAVSIDETLSPQDRIGLAVKVEQGGYLYVIHQPSANRDGLLLFPTRYYNKGDNYLLKGEELILPNCSDPAVPCWLMLASPTASETVKLIFSRARIRELPNHAPAAGQVATVKAQLIDNLLRTSEQELEYVRVFPFYSAFVKTNKTGSGGRMIETVTLDGAATVKAAAERAPTN